METLAKKLKQQAFEEGFDACMICAPTDVPHVPPRLTEFLEHERQGQMSWLAERAHWRGNPAALWPEARSVIMLAVSYAPEGDPLVALKHKDAGTVSVYAQNRDYHDLVKKGLKRLARWLIAEAGGEVKVFVDTAPVAEKPLGQASGLGWQGKHTNLVSRDLGNWFFIGSVFTTLDLPKNEAEVDHCGNCTRCLEVCPTDAFPQPYQLDARRCISYLTIEHSGPVDVALRPALGNRIYGCDDCLAVCPWNKFAVEAREMRLKPRDDLQKPPLEKLARLDDAAFRTLFSGSPVKRIGRNRFVRNVLYAIGNSEAPHLLEVATELLADDDDTVRDAALWAVERLTTT
ncbi:tRNA epoxyqueuosine(34) reductase QueG [Lentibacter algarum]|uniref:tRNA epoxyqueuosine(34) reductase QueG n=1 Tax=Lentibacter algarum TaxID=576131 RepID=UPI001C079BF4|nr:tRNA epoxyqueuosine(34) reductase QueG [Lentibacter algarum]MBU2980317.1 tRNA epoxyqueuosine(34) reductase QueG [Lentibacter algarum]